MAEDKMFAVSLSDGENIAELKSGEIAEDNGDVSAEGDEIATANNGEISATNGSEDTIGRIEREKLALVGELEAKNSLISRLEGEKVALLAESSTKEATYLAEISEKERNFAQLSQQMAVKVDELKKHLCAANKEKESMVMKYALGEKEIIIQRKQREEAVNKMAAAIKERDEAISKAQNALAEKVRLQQLADSRLQDTAVLKKEVDRWTDEAKSQEAKANFVANKLKAEVEGHAETRDKRDQAVDLLAKTRGEIDDTRRECDNFMRKVREDARRDEAVAKEQSVKLMIDRAAATELEELRSKFAQGYADNKRLTDKVRELKGEVLQGETALAKLKAANEIQKSEITDLMSQVAEMESLRMALATVRDESAVKEAKVQRLSEDNSELSADMEACRRKEAELLVFTEKLTEKNVTLQSDLAFVEGRASTLESEFARLTKKLADAEAASGQLSADLSSEKKMRADETGVLAKKLAELAKQLEAARTRVTDAENEVQVLKRKNAASVRELTRELKSECRRKVESNSLNRGCDGHSPTNTLSHSSRASSNSSLNQNNPNCLAEDSNPPPALNHHERSQSVTLKGHPVPDSQLLVDKIVKLQRDLARKHEKIEFMEEHVSTMVDELKKKNRLLQHYMLNEESGALSSPEMDENKRKTSIQGGIMSSLYHSKANDTGMTLELSLEINKKLQGVLEDTLLKNITLKENINTLGKEIANLSGSQPSRS